MALYDSERLLTKAASWRVRYLSLTLFEILTFNFYFITLKKISFIFRERGREGEREGEKH